MRLIKAQVAESYYDVCFDSVYVDGKYEYGLNGYKRPLIVAFVDHVPMESIRLPSQKLNDHFYNKMCSFLVKLPSVPEQDPSSVDVDATALVLEQQSGIELPKIDAIEVLLDMQFPIIEKDFINLLAKRFGFFITNSAILTDAQIRSPTEAMEVLIELASYDYFEVKWSRRQCGSYPCAVPGYDNLTSRVIDKLGTVAPIILPVMDYKNELEVQRFPQLKSFIHNSDQSEYCQILKKSGFPTYDIRSMNYEPLPVMTSQSGIEVNIPAPANNPSVSTDAESVADANKPYREAKRQDKRRPIDRMSLEKAPDREFFAGKVSARVTPKPPPGRSEFPTYHSFGPASSR